MGDVGPARRVIEAEPLEAPQRPVTVPEPVKAPEPAPAREPQPV